MSKPVFLIEHAITKAQISYVVTVQQISAFIFATSIVQSLYFISLKFQYSSHLLWLYSPVCVVPGQKSQRQIFSRCNSNIIDIAVNKVKLLLILQHLIYRMLLIMNLLTCFINECDIKMFSQSQ